ncbi:hypothetical protein ACF0H5_000393 [Mactra antiquata]
MASTGVTGLDKNAIYYEVSPTIICTLRLYNIIGLINVLVAITICIIKGNDNEALYLLSCNLVLSGLICIVVNWWYKRSELPADKYWFVFLLTTVIFFQAIIADVYAFHGVSKPEPTSGPPRTISTHPYTGTTVTWITINMSSITPTFLPYMRVPAPPIAAP